MGILEIVAEKRLGTSALAHHTALKSNLRRIEKAATARPISKTSDEEKQRIAAIVELCFEYDREKDRMERKNILRTLQEIASNEPIELPTQTVQKWDEQLVAEDKAYARLRRRDENRIQDFLKKYFSLFVEFEEEEDLQETEETAETTADNDILARPISDLDLSVRSSNCLKSASINTIGELMNYDKDALMKIKNFGKKSLTEISEKLTMYGLTLVDHTDGVEPAECEEQAEEDLEEGE